MSDTPKYSYWHLTPQERLELARQQREAERKQEQLMLEEAERRKKARLAALRARLESQIQLQNITIQNYEKDFNEIQSSGSESLQEILHENETLQKTLPETLTEEIADQLERETARHATELRKIGEILTLKQRILQEIAETEAGLTERCNLVGLTCEFLSESKRTAFSTLVRSATELDKVRDLAREWNTERKNFLNVFQFYDQKERFMTLQNEMSHWDRRMLLGEKMSDYQQLHDCVEKLKKAFTQGEMFAISPLLLQVENRFSSLSLKLQNDAQALAEIRENCRKTVMELEQKLLQVEKNTASDEFLFQNQNRLREQFERLCEMVEYGNCENFTSLSSRLESEIAEFSQLADQCTRLSVAENEAFSSISSVLWERFAEADRQEFTRKIVALRKQLQNRQCARFEEDLLEIRKFSEQVIAKIRPKVQAWNIHQQAVLARLNVLRDQAESWSVDPSVIAWASEEMTTQTQELTELAEKIEAGTVEFRNAEETLQEWSLKMEQILSAVRELQQKERKRQYLIQRFQEKFQELGFRTSLPYLEDEENPASGIVLTANRPEGRTVNVRFDQDDREPVLYAVDGFPMPKQNVENQTFRTCDEAQRQLEILHKLLEKNGIIMGKVQWEDQPPTDLAREAMELPDTADRSLFNE